MASMGAGGVTVAVGSPSVSSDGLGKNNGDLSSVSPVPYMFNGGFRGRKSSTLERTVERRQRRMIKNRESAARSRARKQVPSFSLFQLFSVGIYLVNTVWAKSSSQNRLPKC